MAGVKPRAPVTEVLAMRCPMLVGRAEARRAIGELLAAGRGALLVEGMAGIGKPALVRAEVPAGAVVVRVPPAAAAPLGSLTELAVGLLGAGASTSNAVLGAHRPVMASLLPGLVPEVAAGGAPPAARRRTR